jgi:outer membrane protein OmpA-like peptidoglycan-associated protein
MTHVHLSLHWPGAIVLALGLAVSLVGHAQDKVLRGAEITESALVDALNIGGPEAGPDSKTRGFRPSLRPTESVAAKPGAGKAPLMITFRTDSAELTPESIAALATVAAALQSDRLAGFSFKVEGHADPRGGVDYNQRLSQLRAEAVVSQLVAQHGILPERLVAVGRGSSELFDERRPEAPENRRVTIVTQRN